MKVSQFPSEDLLKQMKVSELRSHIREFNEHYAIRGYSKLNKSQLISTILTAQKRVEKASQEKIRSPVRTRSKPKPKSREDLQKLSKGKLLSLLPNSLQDSRMRKDQIIEILLGLAK